jgi:uncharacterized repeat protein (TIGR03803 family)
MSRLMCRAGATVTVLLFMQTTEASARWAHTLDHVFKGPDGANPVGGVISDQAGNIYGVSRSGGAYGDGTVFMLSPPVAGRIKWTETVLHSFNHAAGDGANPAAGLVRDARGNLYGTTAAGGALLYGTAFRLAPPAHAGATWAETILHSFGGSDQDGENPASQLTIGAGGKLFGTTFSGGSSGNGTVFQLSPPTHGNSPWAETVLHSFGGVDGSGPMGTLAVDTSGNLFGTTESGGSSNDGAVFQLSPPTPGQTAWTTSVVTSFSYAAGTGVSPLSGVVLDSAGDLVGTTYAGGKHGAGAVFALHLPAQGQTQWQESLLYSFTYDAKRGAFPATGVISDAAGNLYGTTQGGGKHNNGTLFQLSPPASGKQTWTETVLHSFATGTGNGGEPNGTVTPDASGNVFGTAYDGGKFGAGTVFKLSP